jgi:hypothetical protein
MEQLETGLLRGVLIVTIAIAKAAGKELFLQAHRPAIFFSNPFRSVILIDMTFRTSHLLLAAALFASGLPALAQEQGYWRASSSNARQITGDVALAPEKLVINFYSTTISNIRSLEAAEVSSVFDVDSSAKASANLYRLNIPAEKKFQHRNSLCGSEPVTWMVAYASGKTLQLAFFSGQKPPVFLFEEMANSTDRCGTFSYVR